MRTIQGTNGPDRLIGGRSSDLIQGFGGNDTIRAGSGSFTEVYGAGGDDLLFAERGRNEFLSGGAGDDTIHMGQRAASAYTGRGDDVVFAGQGDAFLVGGPGDDTLFETAPASAYSVSTDGDGFTHIIRLDGSQGELIERGFEHVQFAASPPVPPPAAPTSSYTLGAAGDLDEDGDLRIGDGTIPGGSNFSRQVSDQNGSPAVDFGVVPNDDQGGGAFAPTTTRTVGNVTSNTYDLPSGARDVSSGGGTAGGTPDGEATAFIFGFEATDLSAAIAAGDQFRLAVTTNAGTTYAGSVQADPNRAGHFLIVGDNGTSTLADDGGNAAGTFNIEQGLAFGGTIPTEGDVARVDLDVTNPAGVELAGLHNTLRYGAPTSA